MPQCPTGRTERSSDPCCSRLPPAAAQNYASAWMGTLAWSPVGRFAIDFLGHMRPDPRLARTLQGVEFPSPVGLGCGIDVEAVAVQALAQFGFGFIELGPVTCRPLRRSDGGYGVERRVQDESIAAADPPDNVGVSLLAARLGRREVPGVRLVARLAVFPGVLPLLKRETRSGRCPPRSRFVSQSWRSIRARLPPVGMKPRGPGSSGSPFGACVRPTRGS